MKILLITHEFGRRITGGLGRVVNGIFENLSGAQIEVFQIKFPFRIAEDAPKEIPAGERNDFAFLYRKNEQNKVKCVSSGNFRTVLTESIIREAYDCIHIIVNSPVTAECLRIVKESFPEIKTLYSCHSIVKSEIKVRNNSPLELIPEEYLINTVDHIHLLNQTSLAYLKESYPDVVEKGRISIVPNGILEADFTEENASFRDELAEQVNPEQNKVVFCLSRWSHGKGLEYLLDAAAIVSREFENVRFIIAGRKEQSWENELSKYLDLIDEKINRVKDHVITLGWLGNQERNTLFHLANVCVMPSQMEYFPYGLLEPMICGVPIVSSRIDSAVELMGEEAGLFYDAMHAEALAEQLLYLLRNPEAGKARAAKALKKVKEAYTWERVCRHYVDMYRKIALSSKTEVTS